MLSVNSTVTPILITVIQVLRNPVGGGSMSDFPKKSVTKMHGSTLLTLRGGGWVSNFQKKKHYVTLEWPLSLA